LKIGIDNWVEVCRIGGEMKTVRYKLTAELIIDIPDNKREIDQDRELCSSFKNAIDNNLVSNLSVLAWRDFSVKRVGFKKSA
jgi:hypothetical protein